MSDSYIHGYSPAEMQRLTRMQELLNELELGALELRGARRIADFGSGLGQMTRAMARAAEPGSLVVGIEREARQLEAARELASRDGEEHLVEFREGEATAPPWHGDERGTFDLAHARFLLEHVPEPLAVVRAMVAALRLGGRIALVDDDHELLRFWPPCPAAEEVWRRYGEGYRDRGTDPLVGRRLAELLREAGAHATRATTLFFGATRGMARFDLVVDNLLGVLESAASGLDRSGRLPREHLSEARSALAQWRRGVHATIWYSIPFVEGVRTA